ncbi:exported protein of unknown function [Cupriavidus taiwanensis]|nr:exported protein of unknown function [Cupriavidus taiwanensis]SOZ03241.1 exported hypothetical protein [Cupriavidus taiwanensis]
MISTSPRGLPVLSSMVFHVPLGVACASAAALASRVAASTAARMVQAMREGLRMMSPLRFVATPIYWRNRRAAIRRGLARAVPRRQSAARQAACSGRLRVFVAQQNTPARKR